MLGWGILGAGSIADAKVIPAIQASSEAEVVQVVARDGARVARVASRHGIPSYSTSPSSLWDNPDVDVVYVATPPHLHAEQAIAALRHRRHVLCEKPMAMSESEGRAMIRAAEDNDRHLAVAHQMRFHGTYRQARELLAEGLVGSVTMIQMEHLVSLSEQVEAGRSRDHFRRVRAFGGGTILDLGVHDFDAVRFMLQEEIVEVFAFGGPELFPCDVEESAVVVFKTQASVLGTLGLSFHAPGGSSIVCFQGPLGRLVVEQKAQDDRGRIRAWIDGSWAKYGVQKQNPYEAEILHMIKVIQGEEPSLIDGMVGLRSLRIALACRESIQAGAPVRV